MARPRYQTPVRRAVFLKATSGTSGRVSLTPKLLLVLEPAEFSSPQAPWGGDRPPNRDQSET
jgi:hypothetical protein